MITQRKKFNFKLAKDHVITKRQNKCTYILMVKLNLMAGRIIQIIFRSSTLL